MVFVSSKFYCTLVHIVHYLIFHHYHFWIVHYFLIVHYYWIVHYYHFWSFLLNFQITACIVNISEDQAMKYIVYIYYIFHRLIFTNIHILLLTPH